MIDEDGGAFLAKPSARFWLSLRRYRGYAVPSRTGFSIGPTSSVGRHQRRVAMIRDVSLPPTRMRTPTRRIIIASVVTPMYPAREAPTAILEVFTPTGLRRTSTETRRRRILRLTSIHGERTFGPEGLDLRRAKGTVIMKDSRGARLIHVLGCLMLAMSAAVVSAESSTSSERRCAVSIDAPHLSLSGRQIDALATFQVDEDCNVKLLGVRYGDRDEDVPVRAQFGSWVCRIDVWQEDAPDLRMIQVSNVTSWSPGQSGINVTHRTETPVRAFDWWHLEGPAKLQSHWLVEGVSAHTTTEAEFYCSGNYFCLTCKSGTACRIWLRAEMDVHANGTCKAWGTYRGTLVPLGRLNWAIKLP